MTQHYKKRAVDSWSKAITGTIITALALVLNQAGLITGGEDDDKDLANFEKYVLNQQPYSIKIGNKNMYILGCNRSGSNIALMIDLARAYTDEMLKEDNEQTGSKLLNTSKKAFKATSKAFSESASIIFEQSMFKSLYSVISNDDLFTSIFLILVYNLPQQATPTFLGQVAQSFDDTVRTTYEKNDPIGNTLRKIQAKNT